VLFCYHYFKLKICTYKSATFHIPIIIKRVTPHTLRHSYATHLLENGVGIRYIQELLGHAKPETTMTYTHVAKKDLLNIESPLDIALKNISRFDKTKAKLGLSKDF